MGIGFIVELYPQQIADPNLTRAVYNELIVKQRGSVSPRRLPGTHRNLHIVSQGHRILSPRRSSTHSFRRILPRR